MAWSADRLDHRCDRLARPSEHLAIWEAERDPLARLEGPRRRCLSPWRDGLGTPSCPLSIGQVDYTDSQSPPRRKRQGATAADLGIVGVGGKARTSSGITSAPQEITHHQAVRHQTGALRGAGE